MSDPGQRRNPPRSARRSARGALHVLRYVDHHVAFLAGRARWAEAGAPAPIARMRELRPIPTADSRSARVLLVTLGNIRARRRRHL